jgi:hypothetical protein
LSLFYVEGKLIPRQYFWPSFGMLNHRQKKFDHRVFCILFCIIGMLARGRKLDHFVFVYYWSAGAWQKTLVLCF